jgi:hypothetical protein
MARPALGRVGRPGGLLLGKEGSAQVSAVRETASIDLLAVLLLW